MNTFTTIFKTHFPVIIAEIKLASPSHPTLYPGELTPLEIADTYLKNGATALSVLTEPHYFKGNIETIRQIRQAYPHCFILKKDFIMHQEQVFAASAYGANALLLMASLLPFEQLKALYRLAISLNLCPLIEIHTLSELKTVLPLNPLMIGINNRNFETGKVDLQIARELIPHIPASIHTICESGIENGSQIREMSTLGFQGFLIGTTLMKHHYPGQALNLLMKEINNES